MNNVEKYINLSEIIKKLNLAFPVIERDKDIIRIFNGRALMFVVYKKKIQPRNIIPYNDTKWFYKLWTDDYTVMDDKE